MMTLGCCLMPDGPFAQILKINPAKTDIDSFVFDDFVLLNYSPHGTIKMKMAV